jgi:hypothetical protein
VDEPGPLNILRLRAEIGELGGAIRQLRRSGMDSAAAELLITRKRAQLENLLNATANPEPKRTLTATLRHAGDQTK